MTKAFENTQKALYRALKPVFCPALQETIYFNAEGLQHLLYDRGRHRPRIKSQRHYRLSLLPYVHTVLANATRSIEMIKSQNPLVVTWGIPYSVPKNGIQCVVKVIVIRKKPEGKLYFLSVMCERKCQK